MESYFRTGQVAHKLGESSYKIRLLCERGLIAGEFINKQWRIPESEVERLQREGVPEIPATSPPELETPGEPRKLSPKANNAADGDPELFGEASDELRDAAEEAIITGKEVIAAENRLQKRRIQKEEVELSDFFSDRKRREAQVERAEAERTEKLEEARQHEAWVQEWTDRAIAALWGDVPGDVRIELSDAIADRLEHAPRTQPDSLTRRVVDALTDKVLAPWKRRKEIESIIEAVCNQLPMEIKYYTQNAQWKDRAAREVRKTIEDLGDVSEWQIRAAGAAVIKVIASEFEDELRRAKSIAEAEQRRAKAIAEDEQLRTRLVATLPTGLTSNEQKEARESVEEELAPLPVGTSQRKLEDAAARALIPFRQVLAKRADQQLREGVLQWLSYKLPLGMASADQEAAIKRVRSAIAKQPVGTSERELEVARDRELDRITKEHKEQEAIDKLAEIGVRAIPAYVQALNKKYELDKKKSTYAISEELKDPVREALREELDGNESEDEVRKLAHEIVRDELGI